MLKTAVAKIIARLYIYYIYRYYRTTESIISDRNG
jgi:hypothetical protein